MCSLRTPPPPPRPAPLGLDYTEMQSVWLPRDGERLLGAQCARSTGTRKTMFSSTLSGVMAAGPTGWFARLTSAAQEHCSTLVPVGVRANGRNRLESTTTYPHWHRRARGHDTEMARLFTKLKAVDFFKKIPS